jgi:hypothetical protein
LSDAEILSEIAVPTSFYWTEIYISDDRLTFVAQRWSNSSTQWLLNKSNRTNVIVYDVSDVTNPQLIKLSDLDWSYNDSRLIGEDLYVVSDLQINRWYPWQYINDDSEVTIEIEELLPKAISIDYTKGKLKNFRWLNLLCQ